MGASPFLVPRQGLESPCHVARAYQSGSLRRLPKTERRSEAETVAGSDRFGFDNADSGRGGEGGGQEFLGDARGGDDTIAARNQP